MLNSVWYIVEAVNSKKEWYLKYPNNHNEQLKIAAEFKEKSSVGFGVCAGAVDGILIWIHRPTLEESKKVGVDQQKFFCGRKHKYGLNCQAVCDVHGRFLDLSITYGGASSDVLAFENSELFKLLEKGLLLKDLVLFGDNAYLNSSYMATPYPNANGGPKDNYNFFHSQLRIRIECAFGMLVKRWGILRKAIPQNISVKKTIALVDCLEKLHNFCINEADSVDDTLCKDSNHIECDGAGFVQMVSNREIRDVLDANIETPDALIGGGEHFDDVPRASRRDRSVNYEATLPRSKLCMHVESTHMVRPHANKRY
jgi:hypothetical protein